MNQAGDDQTIFVPTGDTQLQNFWAGEEATTTTTTGGGGGGGELNYTSDPLSVLVLSEPTISRKYILDFPLMELAGFPIRVKHFASIVMVSLVFIVGTKFYKTVRKKRKKKRLNIKLNR